MSSETKYQEPRQCHECFWARFIEDRTMFECHYHAPRVVGGVGTGSSEIIWPAVYPNDYCSQYAEMSKAKYMMHWPGKDSPVCWRHRLKGDKIAMHLGLNVSFTKLPETSELYCINCINESDETEGRGGSND